MKHEDERNHYQRIKGLRRKIKITPLTPLDGTVRLKEEGRNLKFNWKMSGPEFSRKLFLPFNGDDHSGDVPSPVDSTTNNSCVYDVLTIQISSLNLNSQSSTPPKQYTTTKVRQEL